MMRSTLLHILRARWFAVCTHAVLWLLLYLAATSLGGKFSDFRTTYSFSAPPQSPAPIAKLESLFAPVEPQILQSLADTNTPSLFFTRYFVPRPSPAPPAPTTRKIELTYLGFYQTADGPRQTIVKVADAFRTASIGASVVTNFFAAEATPLSLTLTNPAGQKQVLPLNNKKEIEVPIP
jgi:hypothetical protein